MDDWERKDTAVLGVGDWPTGLGARANAVDERDDGKTLTPHLIHAT